MSKEITIAAYLSVVKGSLNRELSLGRFVDDMAGDDLAFITQAIGTSEELLDLGDITTPGWVIIQNTSSAAGEIVRLRGASGATDLIEIPPGLLAGPLKVYDGATVYAISESGTPKIKTFILEA